MRAALICPDRQDSDALEQLQAARLAQMEAVLAAQNWSYDRFVRGALPLSLDGYDCVIAAGGDGTQLETAMRLRSTPLCAVRLFPEKSIGFHCEIDYHAFDTMLAAIERGRAHLVEIPRLQAVVDGAPLNTPVLNDILVAHACPARAARYDIAFEQNTESHCSSGIWIATQPGSHGASKSAGAPVLEKECADLAVFCVRECAHKNTAIQSGVFAPGKNTLEITNRTFGLSLFFDGGLAAVPVQFGQKITLCAHPNPLRKWLL